MYGHMTGWGWLWMTLMPLLWRFKSASKAHLAVSAHPTERFRR
jgi:hypothetical protein